MRAATHLDTFRLDRGDFENVMRSHPAGAIYIADQLRGMLSPIEERQVVTQIYECATTQPSTGIAPAPHPGS